CYSLLAGSDGPSLLPYTTLFRSVWFDFSRDGVLRSLEASLKRLGLDRIDIALIHDPDNHEQQALAEAFPALAELRAQGVIRAIGDRKSTRLNSSHVSISYAVYCL